MSDWDEMKMSAMLEALAATRKYDDNKNFLVRAIYWYFSVPFPASLTNTVASLLLFILTEKSSLVPTRIGKRKCSVLAQIERKNREKHGSHIKTTVRMCVVVSGKRRGRRERVGKLVAPTPTQQTSRNFPFPQSLWRETKARSIRLCE